MMNPDELKTASLQTDYRASQESVLQERNACLLEDNKRLCSKLQPGHVSTSPGGRIRRVVSKSIRIFRGIVGFIKHPSSLFRRIGRKLFPLHAFPKRLLGYLGRLIRRLSLLLFSFMRRCFGYCSRQIFRLKAKRIHALSDVLTQLGDYDVVSFDIFDTLLRRDIEPPDLSKRPVAKHAELMFHARGIPLSEEHFNYQRDRAEAFLRKQAVDRGFDTECGLDEIFTLALNKILGHTPSESDIKYLVDYELGYDIEHLSLMPGCQDMLRQLKEMGKMVIAVSDMYYSRQQLLKIFASLGIENSVDHVFVSSEDKIAKHSTRLFLHVLEKLDVTANRMIHIGDNLHSDVRSPKRIGIEALYFNSPEEQPRREALKKKLQNSHLTSHALESQLRQPSSDKTVTDTTASSDQLDGFHKIGHDYFGPSFCAFALHLIDSVICDGMDDVYFMSRDGEIFMRLYNLLKDNVRRYQQVSVPNARYLYVSRRSTTLPACKHLGQREYEIAGLDPQDCGPNALLRKLGLQEEAFMDIVDKYFPGKKNGLSGNAKNKQRFMQFFQDKDFLGRLEIERNKATDLLRKYLDQENFFGVSKRNAFIDIGWNATVQINLTQAFREDSDFPTIQGYYYGRDYAAFNDYTLSMKSLYGDGFAYDNIRYQPIAFFMPFFEYASCASHGSTIRYERSDNGRIEPVLDSQYCHPRQQQALQDGILSFGREFAQSYDHFEPDVDALRDAAAGRLKQLAFYPSRSQAKMLSHVVIDADWGGKGHHAL